MQKAVLFTEQPFFYSDILKFSGFSGFYLMLPKTMSHQLEKIRMLSRQGLA
jgi:hypothetical protein